MSWVLFNITTSATEIEYYDFLADSGAPSNSAFVCHAIQLWASLIVLPPEIHSVYVWSDGGAHIKNSAVLATGMGVVNQFNRH